MREMRRKDRQMSEEQAWAVMDRCEYMVLSMVAENGEPYGVPLNFVRDGNKVYFHGAMEGRKVNCLRYRHKVSLTCVAYAEAVAEASTSHYESAIAFGTVEEVIGKTDRARALMMLAQRFQVPVPVMRQEFSDYMPQTAVWCVTVDTITGKAAR